MVSSNYFTKVHDFSMIIKFFLNSMNKASEATLTYSTFEVVPVSKFLCPESIILFISKICHFDLIPRNHLDKLLVTFSEESIIKF